MTLKNRVSVFSHLTPEWRIQRTEAFLSLSFLCCCMTGEPLRWLTLSPTIHTFFEQGFKKRVRSGDQRWQRVTEPRKRTVLMFWVMKLRRLFGRWPRTTTLSSPPTVKISHLTRWWCFHGNNLPHQADSFPHHWRKRSSRFTENCACHNQIRHDKSELQFAANFQEKKACDSFRRELNPQITTAVTCVTH